MKHKWSHLPNAKYIDSILSHVKNNHKAWATVECKAAWSAAGDAARLAARDSVERNAAWSAPSPTAAWSAVNAAVMLECSLIAQDSAAWSAILALIAWDHAGALLDLPAEQVRVLALLGQPAAILMYPAVSAMENTHVK